MAVYGSAPQSSSLYSIQQNSEISAELLISRNITADESHMLEALICHLSVKVLRVSRRRHGESYYIKANTPHQEAAYPSKDRIEMFDKWQVWKENKRLRPRFFCSSLLGTLHSHVPVPSTLNSAKMCKWHCKAQVQIRREVIWKSWLEESYLPPSHLRGFNCLEEYQIDEPSKSKQERLVHLLLYKVYTQQHKFPFSSVLGTKATLMPWDFLLWLAVTGKSTCQTPLVCGSPGQASCFFS